ncbi:MAG: DoxX family membrane protein [Dehalococcoidia bacterium]|nr:DoxX family membrane protein [Dehalococcoidia bacterium]
MTLFPELLTDPLRTLFDWDAREWAMLPLRLVLGYVFVYSGFGKFRRGISGTGRWFAGLGFPAPQALARLVASVELGGGLLLMVGLFVPWVAVPLFVNMLVATWTQKFRLRAPFGGGDVQGYELDVLMAAGAFTLVLGGAGPLSLDALLD